MDVRSTNLLAGTSSGLAAMKLADARAITLVHCIFRLDKARIEKVTVYELEVVEGNLRDFGTIASR